MQNIDPIILIICGVYLLVGFIYAIYVVLNGGGGIFSIPINTLLGPISLPINYYAARKSLDRKVPQEAPKDIPQEEEEETETGP